MGAALFHGEERQRLDGAAMVSAVVSRGGVCVLKFAWVDLDRPPGTVSRTFKDTSWSRLGPTSVG